MTDQLQAVKFHFHNGGEWKVDSKYIGDLWIKRISTSIGRIDGGEIKEIHPAQALKIEILAEADTVETNDINKGSLEVGIFETVLKNKDVEWMTLIWKEKDDQVVYFPFASQDQESGTENLHMSAKVEENKSLYVVIDENHRVDDFY